MAANPVTDQRPAESPDGAWDKPGCIQTATLGTVLLALAATLIRKVTR